MGNDEAQMEANQRAASILNLIAQFTENRDENRLIDAARIGNLLSKILPNNDAIWLEQGNLLKTLGAIRGAIFCYRKAISVNPNMFVAALQLGHILLERCKWYQTWQQAGLREKPWSTRGFCDDLNAPHFKSHEVLIVELYNLGLDLGNAGYLQESIACLQIVVNFCPGIVQAHYALGCALLSDGQFDRAKPVLIKWGSCAKKNFKVPYWQGEDLSEKTLYVFVDQGLGDIIQFIRFVPAASKMCRRLILYIPEDLRKIVGDIQGVEIISKVNHCFDVMCSLFLLPHIIGINGNELSKMVPYLYSDPTAIADWNNRLPKGGFRIGIAWQGNPSSQFDQGRSIPLACYAPLARIPGVKLISLQMTFGLGQLDSLPEGMTVTTLGPEFNAGPDNVVDTAAVMQNLDLIISTDTSVPHIAGALGCPVFVMLKAVPDWRWMMEREDCPWYPTMRLFRQKTPGDWNDVMDRVVEAVVERMISAP